MEQQQVVKVHGARFGSGYLIAPRLVLTSAHLLGGDHSVSVPVSVPGSPERFAAQVRWTGGETLDAALLEITAAHWSPPTTLRGHLARRPQRWGRCVTGGTEIPVAATGFPRQQRGEEVRDSEAVVGRVRPHGGTTLEILDASGPFGDGDPSTRWSGMSGAAVFPDGEELLLGVVRFDRQAHHGTRLTATRAEDLVAHPDFRAAVRRVTGVDPQLEPVELAELLEPAPPMEVSSPTMLLRADAEVVSFHGREDVLAGLEQWCLADGPPAARVLTGPGGQGKTRVARQLMARLRDHGWVTGEVHSEPGELRVLRAVQHPLLLVVDYAESRPDLVRRLWKQTERNRHPVRLLLLARSRGSWETRATGHLREIRLHALSPDHTDRDHAFRLAARDLARRIADVTERSGVDWPGLAETLPVPRAGAGAETALTVQMAALVALLRQAPDAEQRPLEAELLDHEYNHWTETATGRGLGNIDAGRLAQAVAAAVLCPALTETEALATIARVLPHEPLVADLAAWLRDLYPPPEGRYWGQLEPDRVGEYHAAGHVVDDPGLLTRVFARAPDHQRVQTLTVLARAAVAHANEKRTVVAHRVVDRLRTVLREADTPLTAAMLRAHSDALPAHSHVLRDYALDVARELARLCDGESERDRAWALHNLAERHLAVGDWADAVGAANEAAMIRGRLAEHGQTTDRTEWADSQVLLSRALRGTGRRAESYQVGDQALRLFRELAADSGEDREKRERGLVRALLNQAQVVWRLDPETIGFDQIARSDGHTDEAVRLARDLTDRIPDLDPILLTDALTQRSVSLFHLQRRPEALAPSEEAVRSARRLAGENPDAYAGDLAGALMGLAVDHNLAGRPTAEVMALEQEAIDLLRPLASDLPDVYRSTLARTLHNLAIDQFEAQDEGAWAAIEEVIDLRRAGLQEPLGIGAPELAGAVHTFATFHVDRGDHSVAVTLLEWALELYEDSTLPLSAGELRSQSGTALELARSYRALGRMAEALTAAKQANAIRRRLSEYAPSIYLEPYATSLRDISDLHRSLDHRIHERIALRHALSRHRRLARDSDEGREGLAICLADLGASYAVSWTTVGRAVTALTEAYELFVSLPVTEPRHERNVAIAAGQLSGALLKTSRFADAVRIAEHEVRLRRRLLVEDEEDDHEWALYFALLRLAEGRTMAARPAAAWRTVLEAEEACRTLVERPDLTQVQVALFLRTLARAMSLCGRHDVRLAARALAPARRAARICRGLADKEPGNYQIDLRLAVSTLVTVLTRLGRHAEAADVRLRRGA